MLRSIFTKTIYERRWSTFIWFLATSAMVLLVMALYPALRDALGASLQEVPESLESFLGDAATYQTIPGYVDLQVIAQMVFLTIIMGVITGNSLIAGEEKSGTLQTLLAQPVRRSSVYVQKLAALAIMTAIVCSGLFFGVMLGVQLIGETIAALPLLKATAMTWLVTFFFASMTYGLGAATGSRAIAGVLTGFYAFISYMLTALAGLATSLENLNYGSPFYYFNSPSVILHGLDWGNVSVLAIGSLVFIAIGILRFTRRDLAC